MNLRSHRHDEPEVNLTSLIDVVLMLLIFFMVATTFDREAALKVDLPKANSAPAVNEEDTPLQMVITADSRFYIERQEVINPTPVNVKRALAKVTEGRREVHLSIRAAGLAPHQAVVTAMDAAGQLGITRLSIATLQPEGAD
jgi:biopolymer transport protein ExbD